MQIQAILSIREAFKPAFKAGVPVPMLAPQILVYLLLSGAGVAMGLYKANRLGFLPTTQSDWISLLPPRMVDDGFLRRAVFLN